ncbi:MAG TPA: DNA topoisomerase IV, partial [Microbacterium sp.]|nr:DNA topoisomerase IV [Microbacterium sp.]
MPAPASEPPAERIEDVDVSSEMQGSFLEYAYSVIYSRALPDARDGMKPVQRRIVYQMSEMGLRPDRGHVKSARVVGEVMGKLHPHGDAPIYDALVRLAQPFSQRVPLVDGHGNFGSLDDGPAASRYTEARLAPAALAMAEGLDEDVVDFIPNYDNQFQQPAVLPAAYPNLLVNGASGIAVGMATNMAPHNLIEVVGAAIHLLENPDATLEDLMAYVPGPDLPSGGVIVGLEGIRDAYATGRGSFKTRARSTIESLGPRKTGIVVTELPYLVGPERVIEKIKDAVQSKKLQGISDVADLTDRSHGTRLVIGIKTGFDPQAVLEALYRLTPLEDSFGINNVALVEGQPRTLGLRDLLRVYVDHRLSVVTRRSRYRLDRRRERLHLVEGLLIAILDIDEVIQVIRASDDGEQARKRLMEVFDLSQLQAEYILELRLRRLTKFSRIELEAERDRLLAEIAQLEALLGSDSLLRKQVTAELGAVAEKLGTPRRTLLTNAPSPAAVRPSRNAPVLEITDAPTVVVLSTTGLAVRVDLSDDTDIVSPARRSSHDAVLTSV